MLHSREAVQQRLYCAIFNLLCTVFFSVFIGSQDTVLLVV